MESSSLENFEDKPIQICMCVDTVIQKCVLLSQISDLESIKKTEYKLILFLSAVSFQIGAL